MQRGLSVDICRQGTMAETVRLFVLPPLLDCCRRHFHIPDQYSTYLNGLTRDTYLQLLREVILGKHAPEEVILLEILPHQQKTRIDFYCTADYTGIPIVCLTEVQQEGRRLFYEKDGKKMPVKRIYNRIIFDELQTISRNTGDG